MDGAMLKKSLIAMVVIMCGSTGAWADAKSDCLQDHDADLSIKGCTNIISEQPHAVWAYGTRGNAYFNKGDYDSAIADASKVIEINPKSAAGHFNRGLAYDQKEEGKDRAIADYTKAIEVDPKNAKYYARRGSDFADQGQIDEAISDVTKAIELEPASPKKEILNRLLGALKSRKL